MQTNTTVKLLKVRLRDHQHGHLGNQILAISRSKIDITIRRTFNGYPRCVRLHRCRTIPPTSPSVHITRRLSTLSSTTQTLVHATSAFFITDCISISGSQTISISRHNNTTNFIRMRNGHLAVPSFTNGHRFGALNGLLLGPQTKLLFVSFAANSILRLDNHDRVVLSKPRITTFRKTRQL